VAQGARLEVEGQQRRVAQLAETPLVRIRDERKLTWSDDGGRACGGAEGGIDVLEVEQKAAGEQLVGQAAGAERLPVSRAGRLNLSMNQAVAAEDEAGRIAERGRVDLDLVADQRSGRSESAAVLLSSRWPRTRRHTLPMVRRKKNGTASTLARITCRIMLPEPGSI
jgi:hypothetical protein